MPLALTVGAVVSAGDTLCTAYPVIEPLSVVVVGLTFSDPLKATDCGVEYVKVGALLAVTVMVRVSVADELPSFACNVKVAAEAPQLAEMSAVTLPFVLTIF